ncbi:MAG: metalloprotease [Halobacteriales archaeon]
MSGLRFSGRELRDFAVAWLALGVAFTLFLDRGLVFAAVSGTGVTGPLVRAVVASLLTVGAGFLLHELAHKIVAVRFGQVAEFRADYGMLFLAVVSALVGFLFAAPGAVYHRGRTSPRENGLIALAGPAANVLLAGLFYPLSVVGPAASLADLGVTINVLLAGFNLLPVGPLDGRTVLAWSLPVYLAVAVPGIGLAAAVLLL